MGHHYVPRDYLRAFCSASAPGSVWLYVKGRSAPTFAPIKTAAQSKSYYSAEEEKRLATDIEGPANLVLRRLRAGLSITTTEQEAVVRYLGAMMKRVPYRRRKALEQIPGVIQSVTDEYKRQARELGKQPGVEAAAQRFIDRVEDLRIRYLAEPPPDLVSQALAPEVSEGVLDLIRKMSWRLIEARGPRFFMTTDNPMFFFEGYGLGKPQSEFVFPLSPLRAIHGSWQPVEIGKQLVIVNEDAVNEINHRIATTTERLAFYSEPVDWIFPLLERTDQTALSRIGWD